MTRPTRPDNMPEITWRTDNLSLEACAYVLGYPVADLRAALTGPNFAGHADTRALGYWTANERELCATWKSLARLTRDASRQPLSSDAIRRTDGAIPLAELMRLYHTLLGADFTLDGSTLECDSSNSEACELARDLTTCLHYEGLAGESAYRYLRDVEPMYRVEE